ncbi:MAG: gas vesicle protein K [Rhodobacter sp.]|nr:gas vesicle protein K [Rhodobacter sp.]
MEWQAISRFERFVQSGIEIERIDLTLMCLETSMTELKAHFGMVDKHLSLHLGSGHDLKDILNDEG